jgi:simple sugar transport system permease protein
MFIGSGLRPLISLVPFEADHLLENLWQFNVFGVVIRTGTLLVVVVASVLMWLFFRSKTGISISAIGMNPVFARATGLNVDRGRVIANMISTSLAAAGLIIYAQGFGFVQLYIFPLMMAFPAVAAILVGGANAHRSKVIHVIIGTFLFQCLITTGPPIFGRILEGEIISDAVRQVVQNGVILYVLTQLKGDNK